MSNCFGNLFDRNNFRCQICARTIQCAAKCIDSDEIEIKQYIPEDKYKCPFLPNTRREAVWTVIVTRKIGWRMGDLIPDYVAVCRLKHISPGKSPYEVVNVTTKRLLKQGTIKRLRFGWYTLAGI